MAITKTSTLNMTEKEWAESRRGSIGGSDAAAVVGLNPYCSPYALWAEKSGAIAPEDISGKESVRLGKYLEQYIADRFTEETGLKVRRENSTIRNSDYPFAHANVDRMIIGAKEGLECKYTDSLNLRQYKGGEYPARFYVQCVHYLMVTGFRVWHLAVLCGNKFLYFRIERDDEEIAALANAEKVFWDGVVSGTAPEVDGLPSTSDTIAGLTAPEVDEAPADLAQYMDLVSEYLALKSQLDAVKERTEAAANRLKQSLGHSVVGLCGGYKVSWKPVCTRCLDKAALFRDHPEIPIEKYLIPSVSRRFSVKEISK